MSDAFDLPDDPEREPRRDPPGEMPREAVEPEAPDDDPSAPRQRHDAFGEERKGGFLEELLKTRCILDAARAVGVSPRTVYNHQEKDPRFAESCRVVLAMGAAPLEIAAWQRAVEGVPQEFACGGQVHVRQRYSDGLLRLLLQGSNPKKYGPNPGFGRKRMLKHERKQMEREIRAEYAEKNKPMSFDDAIAAIDKQLASMDLHGHRRSAGWTETPDGDWIPPGYGPIPGWIAPQSGEEGRETPRDSV